MTPAALRKARQSLGLTQEGLAKRMGYNSKSVINTKEKGVKSISLQDEKFIELLKENTQLRNEIAELLLSK